VLFLKPEGEPAAKEYAMADNAGSKISFFLVGLGIGALVGILFAPKSGEETREYLSQKADEGREYAQRKARELRERADDLVERGKSVASRQKDSISAAVDAGRDAYQKAKAQ
jgi:gas vesicle protein